jgi:hypothetical protein
MQHHRPRWRLDGPTVCVWLLTLVLVLLGSQFFDMKASDWGTAGTTSEALMKQQQS